jgi:signal transduction histidine kinase
VSKFRYSIKRIEYKLVAVSVALFVILFCGAIGIIRSSASARLNTTVDAVLTHQNHQGLVLDSAGMGSLVANIIERDGSYFVRFLSIQRAPELQVFESEFSQNGRSAFSEMRLFDIHISVKNDGSSVKAVLIPSIMLISGAVLAAIVISCAFLAITLLLRKWNQTTAEFISTKLLAEHAAQVAHDIRSPLAALNVALAGTETMPEAERVLIRSAIGRISDIANNLLDQKRRGHQCSTVQMKSIPQLIPVLVESLVSEKRQQYRPTPGVQIDFQLTPASYGLFACIEPVEFKRVLSNLINNAVESLPGRGRIVVDIVSRPDEQIELRVCDDGKGIAPELLPDLMNTGQTYEKQGGIGLGLSHARSAVQSWKGTIHIASTIGEGTTVTIVLPLVSPPTWFAREILLSDDRIVMVLDDDPTIHLVWAERFGSLTRSAVSDRSPKVRLLHLSSPEEFRAWCSSRKTSNMVALYLIDQEFAGSDGTGLQLIETLGLQSRSILVTSRFDEEAIIAKCKSLTIPIIPKPMAGLVPISYI